MSFRRLGVLLRALPPESATKTAMREALTDAQRDALPEARGHGPWSAEMHLLASIADTVRLLAWQQSQIHGGPKSSPPEPIPRPGVSQRQVLTTQQAAYLQKIRDERRAR